MLAIRIKYVVWKESMHDPEYQDPTQTAKFGIFWQRKAIISPPHHYEPIPVCFQPVAIIKEEIKVAVLESTISSDQIIKFRKQMMG